LVPSNKRPTFGRMSAKRRRRTNLASIEFAGRWSLLRSRWEQKSASEALAVQRTISQPVCRAGAPPAHGGSAEDSGRYNAANAAGRREAAIDKFARVLLRRYGIVFRRLLERE